MQKSKQPGEQLTKEQAIARRAAAIKGKYRPKKHKEHTPCYEGCNYKPFKPCEFGKNDVCSWGLQAEEYNYCVFDFVQNNQDGATLQAVANAIGQSKQRIQQVEAQALEKLRRRLQRSNL